MAAPTVVQALQVLRPTMPARNLAISAQNIRNAERILRMNEASRIKENAGIAPPAQFTNPGPGARLDIRG